MKKLVFIFGLLFILLVSFSGYANTGDLGTLPVQEGGRIKPFETFAKETLQLIYGKEKFAGAIGDGSPRPATEVVMTWVLQPQAWVEVPLFEVRHGELKKSLKLEEEKRYFSFSELMSNERFSTLMQDLASKREAKEKLDPFYQALDRMENQLITFREVAAGRMIRVWPPKEGDTWLSLAEVQGVAQEKMMAVTKAFVGVLATVTNAQDRQSQALASEKLNAAVTEFKTAARSENSAVYPEDGKLAAELHLNRFHPFRWAWISYLIGALLILALWAGAPRVTYGAAWVAVSAGLLLNVYGFALRVYLLGRPPVSNMYETVVWVGFGAVVFAMFIEAAYKWRFILFSGALAGAFCLALADAAPTVLDPSLQPLEPVLRNNFWLLVHVLTITIAYAAFFLGFILGDIGLLYYLKGEEQHKAKLKAITLAVYRSMQIGISFLAPGIILGGVWADYSWGRFWGWDPKETWALIVLLGYLAVLHGRLVGMIKDFGMICSSVVTFSLVIMAWYGVNYVLGAGLHSYGFGAGGVEYVALFVGAHFMLVLFATIVRSGRLKQKNLKTN